MSEHGKENTRDILQRLEATLVARKGAEASTSYVASLYAKGIDTILKKIGEEAAETIIAAKGSDRSAVVRETADLVFHTLVMLAAKDIKFDEVLEELARREGKSGNAEKAARGKID
jgi:phosphoribosyl-ATP pyrophosphohydrolase